jgi:dTDP-4-amino-4,6-dideoxygalactose transaminase
MNGSDKNPPLHVGRPNIGNRSSFLERVNKILDRRWLSNNGPVVQEFEKRVAEILGVKHALAICNATAAICGILNADRIENTMAFRVSIC